jgi:predicted esterase
MQVFNPSNNQIFVFVDSPYFDESSLERGHKGYLAWPRKKGVTENYNLIQESIDLQSEYLSKISKQIQTQYNANSKINIIGFSQGGVQAYSFASDFGDTVEKLILWATPIKNLTFGKVVEKNVKVTILHNLDDDNVSIDNSTWLHEKLQLLSIASALFKGKGLHKLTNLQISQILGELQE